MKDLFKYIDEKLHISKGMKTSDATIDEVNEKFVIALKNYLHNKYAFTFDSWNEYIDVSKSKEYLLLSIRNSKRYLYKSIMSFIDKSYPVRKPCSTNNSIVYIYPDYEYDYSNTSITERLHIKKSAQSYTYYPKDRDELKSLIKKLIEERGDEADLNDIDVSNVTDMSHMFEDFFKFNGDISSWDVSNVKAMNSMFSQCRNFNSDLSNWDVSNVTNMRYMFSWSKFNGDISNWNVSNVTDMRKMFVHSRFNGDISSWDVSNVTNMSCMFYESKFNKDISKWDVSNVKNMDDMFEDSPLEKNPPKWYHE